MPADGAGHGQHVLQVGAAVLVGRRAHGDEQHVAVRDGLRGVGGEGQAAGTVVGQHHVLEAGLEDRAMAFIQAGHPIGIDIHAQHRMAYLGQAHRLGQADIAGSENRDLHLTAP